MGSMAKKIRIDQLLVSRGLAESRTRAQALVMAGLLDVPVSQIADAWKGGLERAAEGAGAYVRQACSCLTNLQTENGQICGSSSFV